MDDPFDLRALAERALDQGLIGAEELREGSWSVGERYRVQRVLGRGGAGTVFHVVDEQVGRDAALKLLDGSPGRDSGRFLQEIRLLASLGHPGIVTIYGSGVHEGAPYYVMEHAPEGTLAEATLELRAWVRVLVQVCLAIGAAHARGIVHRDLKPENVLLVEGAPRVADFGVAKELTSEGPGRTKLNVLVGTPAAMAPEQCGAGAGEVGPWTDVHALGVMLYERLTGEPLFPESLGFLGLIAAILGEARPDPRQVAPGAPAGLCAIASRAIAREASERYPDATAMARELHEWLERDADGAEPKGGLPSTRARVGLALGGLIALLGLGGGAAILLAGASPRQVSGEGPRPSPSAEGASPSGSSPSSSPSGPIPSGPSPSPSGPSPSGPSPSPSGPSPSPSPSGPSPSPIPSGPSPSPSPSGPSPSPSGPSPSPSPSGPSPSPSPSGEGPGPGEAGELLGDLARAPLEPALLERARLGLAEAPQEALLRAVARRLRRELWRGVGDPRPMREAGGERFEAPLARLRQAVGALPASGARSVALAELIAFRAYFVQDLEGFRDQAEAAGAAALRDEAGPEGALAELSRCFFGLRFARSMRVLRRRAAAHRERIEWALDQVRARGGGPELVREARAVLAKIEAL